MDLADAVAQTMAPNDPSPPAGQRPAEWVASDADEDALFIPRPASRVPDLRRAALHLLELADRHEAHDPALAPEDTALLFDVVDRLLAHQKHFIADQLAAQSAWLTGFLANSYQRFRDGSLESQEDLALRVAYEFEELGIDLAPGDLDDLVLTQGELADEVKEAGGPKKLAAAKVAEFFNIKQRQMMTRCSAVTSPDLNVRARARARAKGWDRRVGLDAYVKALLETLMVPIGTVQLGVGSERLISPGEKDTPAGPDPSDPSPFE